MGHELLDLEQPHQDDAGGVRDPAAARSERGPQIPGRPECAAPRLSKHP